MKKFIFTCSTLLFIACSHEVEYNAVEKQSLALKESAASRNTTSDFDDAFNNYIHSVPYVNWNSKMKTFVQKMKFSGNIQTINTKEKMFLWISSHLGSTEFSGMSEVNQRWMEIEGLAQINFQANLPFYQKIPGNKIRFGELLLNEQIITIPSSACKDELKACNSAAVDEYAAAMEQLVADYNSGMSEGAVTDKMSNAYACYQSTLNACNYFYLECISH